MQLLDEKLVTARKDHECLLCNEQIKKADVYKRQKIVSDGELGTVKICLHCENLIKLKYDQLIDDWDGSIPAESVFILKNEYNFEGSTKDFLESVK